MHRAFPLLVAALTVLPAVKAPAQKAVLSYLGGLKVAAPASYQNLTVFPLTSTSYERSFDALTLDQATRQGAIRITELGSGNVNRVLVENTSKRCVFLMAGELLAGCKQDRMVANDCLLEPRSGKVELSVFCTEHGRWTSQSRDFKSLEASAHVRMRQVAKESGSQQQVWDEVRSKAAGLSVAPAPTEALQSVIGDKEVAARCVPYKKHFDRIPSLGPNVVGVAVAAGDEIICIDVFASPSLFRTLWPKLLQSYVLDVIDRPDQACRVVRRDVERILDRAPDADFRPGNTDGVGSTWAISGNGMTGSALAYRSSVVHCDLFPSRPVVSGDSETPKLDYRRHRTR